MTQYIMTVTEGISLGPRETRVIFEFEARGTDLFTLKEVKDVLGTNGQAAVQIVARLRRKGRVVEIRKGTFLLVPARAGVAGRWSENIYRIIETILNGRMHYVGLWSAMNYWEMTEQMPRTTHVVVADRRRAFDFHGQRVRFVTLKSDRIFGFVREPLERGGFSISDREKTILDGLLLPRYCGGIGEVAKAISAAQAEIRWRRLDQYLERLDVAAVRRRLGYLLDLLEIETPLRLRLPKRNRGLRWLDPSAPLHAIDYSHEWGLIVNVSPTQLKLAGRS